jgi:fructosamine-3-kinase
VSPGGRRPLSGFRKHDPHAPAGFFEAEAAGLRWLRAAGGAQVVEVVDVGPGWIELDELRSAPATPGAAESFGRALVVTHASGAPCFGSPPDGYDGPTFIGRQGMSCEPRDRWGAFYAEQRVLPYARKAFDRGHLTAADLRVVEQACALVEAGMFDAETRPARLHGDLWNGNVVWTERGAVLIDPAAHGGHPETDLAMLALFSAPHLDRILDAYVEAAGLDQGWRKRMPVHQLHPLAVHAASHGPSYSGGLRRAAEMTLALGG